MIKKNLDMKITLHNIVIHKTNIPVFMCMIKKNNNQTHTDDDVNLSFL